MEACDVVQRRNYCLALGGGGVHGGGPSTPVWSGAGSGAGGGVGMGHVSSPGYISSPGASPGLDDSPVGSLGKASEASTCYSDNKDEGQLLRPD